MVARKGLNAIAEAVRSVDIPEPAREVVARHLADALAPLNPNFDRRRFLTAAGVDPRGPAPLEDRPEAPHAE